MDDAGDPVDVSGATITYVIAGRETHVTKTTGGGGIAIDGSLVTVTLDPAATAGRVSAANNANSYIGRYHVAGGYYNSDIGEVLICDTALSVANLNDLGAYLSDKWGLAWTPVA